MPQLAPRWIRTSVEAAQTARTIQQQISPNDEVVASHARLVGRFADRASVYSLWAIAPYRAMSTWSIRRLPYEGINVESVNKSLAILDAARERLSRDVTHQRDGVWWFTVDCESVFSSSYCPRLQRRSGLGMLREGRRPVVTGPLHGGTPTGGFRRGYVVSRAYWRARRGTTSRARDTHSRRACSGIFEVWGDHDARTASSASRFRPGQAVASPFRSGISIAAQPSRDDGRGLRDRSVRGARSTTTSTSASSATAAVPLNVYRVGMRGLCPVPRPSLTSLHFEIWKSTGK